MSLISVDSNNKRYVALSTDIVTGRIPMTNTGCIVYLVDTGETKVVKSDGTLGNYVVNNGATYIQDVDQVIEIQTDWAKNTPQDTEKTAVRIPKPTNPVLRYKVAMHNPSIDSDLLVKLFNRRTFTETGTAQDMTNATHITLDAKANPTVDYYNGYYITITGGTGAGQVRLISDYEALTCIATVSVAWVTALDNTSEYSIAMVVDSLAYSAVFAKSVLSTSIVKANDSTAITALFDDGCDVYYVVSNETAIANADASRFSSIFQLIPIA
jgi:hypothetical protein